MGDKIMGLLALALLAYCYGCTNRDLTGPADIWRDVRAGHRDNGWEGWTGVWTDIVSGHHLRRSGPVDTAEGTGPPNVLSNVHPAAGGGPLRPPVVPDPQRPWGGQPLDALLGEHDDDQDDDTEPARYTPADRRPWVTARMCEDDLSPSEIDRMGAEIFECTERTIRRDREAIRPTKGAAR